MKKEGWRNLAIIFMVLFFLETALFGYGVIEVLKDDKFENSCYFDVCDIYPEAYYLDRVCYCYTYDLDGDLEVAKTKVMS